MPDGKTTIRIQDPGSGTRHEVMTQYIVDFCVLNAGKGEDLTIPLLALLNATAVLIAQLSDSQEREWALTVFRDNLPGAVEGLARRAEAERMDGQSPHEAGHG